MFLAVIHGLPATGKSTIARDLQRRLDVPLIELDRIKELGFDMTNPPAVEAAWKIGGPATRFAFDLADTVLARQQSLLLEGAFNTQYDKPEVQKLLDRHHPNFFELYCQTDPNVRRSRYKERYHTGTRNPGHFDTVNFLADDEPEPYATFAPLEIGRTILINTTDLDDIDIQAYVDTIAQTE